MRIALNFTSGSLAGKAVPVNKSKLVIGRAEDCDVRPESDRVSRHHCVFKVDEYTVRVRDLGSKNGTYVNGHLSHGDTILTNGDRVQIGDMEMTVTIRPDAPPHSDPTLPTSSIPPAEGDTKLFDTEGQ
jgi:pSer/pThr/pTyr-binding forkhead associated (FHA) protein